MDTRQGEALRKRRVAARKKSITVEIPELMWTGIGEHAQRIGLRRDEYARMLLEAAYAVRVGKVDDHELDTMIGIVAVLAGKLPTAQIAKGLKLSEDKVVEIIAAWREETAGRA